MGKKRINARSTAILPYLPQPQRQQQNNKNKTFPDAQTAEGAVFILKHPVCETDIALAGPTGHAPRG